MTYTFDAAPCLNFRMLLIISAAETCLMDLFHFHQLIFDRENGNCLDRGLIQSYLMTVCLFELFTGHDIKYRPRHN